MVRIKGKSLPFSNFESKLTATCHHSSTTTYTYNVVSIGDAVAPDAQYDSTFTDPVSFIFSLRSQS
jgi:hypothetical protein